jgi:DNA polymerase-1
VFALRKGVKDIVLYDEDLVKEKFRGLSPSQILDYKALRGDASDNIPGVTGIGEKTAIDLLLKFKDIDNLYNQIKENSKISASLTPRLKETIIKYQDQAFLSRELAQIDTNAPIPFTLEICRFKEYDKEKAIEVLKGFDFNSLVNKLPWPGSEEGKKAAGENLKLW